MFSWNKYPLLRILGCYFIGIILAFWFRESLDDLFFPLLILLLGIVVLLVLNRNISYQRQKWIGIIFLILFSFSGFINTQTYISKGNPPVEIFDATQKTYIVGDIIEPPLIKPNSVKLILKINQFGKDSIFQTADFKVILFVKRDSESEQLSHGDRIISHLNLNRIEPPKNPEEFDYKRYLEVKQIHAQGYAAANTWQLLDSNKGNPLMIFASKTRNVFLEILRCSRLNDEELGVIAAILLGADDKLDAELSQSYSSAGVSHVLCVSGMHVGIIFMIINYLLFFLNRNKRQRIIKTLLLISTVWLYACITGMAPSVMRAATMFTFVSIGNISERPTNTYNSLLTSAFFLTLFNPLLIFEVGFQLSYFAVFGIVWLQKSIYNWYTAKTKLGDYAWNIMSVSLAAQLATGPIAMFYFHQFPNYFLLSNIVVITLAPFIVGIGILILVFSFWEFAYEMLSLALNYIIKGMNYAVTFIESIPFSTIQNIYFSGWQILFLYFFVLLFASAWLYKRKYSLLLSLTCLLLVFGLGLVRQTENRNREEIVFYASQKDVVIDCIKGSSCYIYSKNNALNEENPNNFHTQNYRVKCGAKQLIFMDTNFSSDALIKRNHLIHFKGKNIMIADNLYYEHQTENKLEVDYLIMTSEVRLPIEKLLLMINPQKILFDVNIYENKLNAWLKECEAFNIPHYLLSNGALVERL